MARARGYYWLKLKLEGSASNHSVVGPIVWVKANIGGVSVWQMRQVNAGGNLFVQHDIRPNFGLGDATVIDSIKIEWPSGMVDILTGIGINQFLTVTESILGDANGDDQINVGDAVLLINYVFKGGPAPDPIKAGDANCDGQVNVGDAVYLINYVFRGGPEPSCH